MVHSKALVVGVGDGLSASLARLFHAEGYEVVLSARDIGKISALRQETGAQVVACDASNPAQVQKMMDCIEGSLGICVYNPSYRQRGPLVDLDPAEVERSIRVTAFGSFLVGQAAARRMLEQNDEGTGRGAILFTGASAGVKGFAQSAPFAMGKFAQRGLAQSMARELHPQGIHVAWVNIDGAIRNPGRSEPDEKPQSMLDPDEIARNYLALIRQNRSAWTDELTLRPWVERF
ncbi:MAG: SDR family NAD(P)-dependent oxidoreductase [Hoeflea sp.]|uniref:SDR family NAD(P)-dependent oxidoreductase n=1 Tax=Hoeflea sp. TaxID=1940281 RepID=UPI00329A3167